jgi:hypothetical protein
VGEQPVEADGHAEAGQQVADEQHDQVADVQPFVPHLPSDQAEAQDRDDRHGARDDAVAGLVGDGLDVVARTARLGAALRGCLNFNSHGRSA